MLERTVLHALFKAITSGAVPLPRNAANSAKHRMQRKRLSDIWLVLSFVCNEDFVWFLKVDDQHASWRTTIEFTFHTGN